MLIHALEQALLFVPLVFAVFVSLRILRITDLTAEGSFILGASLFSLCVDAKLGLATAMVAALLGGVFAGSITCALQRILGFTDLIAGILAIFILQSLCLKSMGRPNISLYDKPSLLSFACEQGISLQEPHLRLFIALGIGLVLFIFLSKVLTSRLGLMLRAFGNNHKLLEILGKNEKVYCLIGLVLSNVFAALGGAITAQFQGFADIGMGTGVVLIALASVIIGERLGRLLFGARTQHISIQLLSCFLGIFLYFLAVHSLLKAGIDPINLRMTTALLVVVVLSINRKQIQRSYA